MKAIKLFLIIAFFLFFYIGLDAQTYCFTAPQGFGAATTGGGTGAVTTVTNFADLKTALTATGNKIILVSGTITCTRMDVVVTNKTIIGLPGAKLVNTIQTKDGSGIIQLKSGSNNVIIRNLIFEGPGAYDEDGHDNLENTGCTNLWVDHCEFQDGMDGNFDNTKVADNITVSWCKFTYLKAPKAGGSGGTADHRFTNLVSGSDSDYPSDGMRNITWQYCWWTSGCKERMVRARNAQLHQLNCYWNSSVTSKAIGLSAGDKGCSDYVESGVFECSGKVSDLSYGGSPTIKFVSCTGGGTDVGTVNKPSYSYEVTPVGQVVAAVTNSNCGAGATLQVTTAGVVSASCGTLTAYSLATNATNGTITRSPNATTYNSGTVVTLTATPNAGYQFSGWSGDASGSNSTTTVTMSAAKTVTATFTLIVVAPTLALTTGTSSQTVTIGTAITNIVYTWGGGATDVSISGLPVGLTSTKNSSAKTITISGTPTSTGTYTITTVQSSGTAVQLSGTITVNPLSVPSGVTATATTSSLVIKWNAVTNATGYVIHVCDNSSVPVVKNTWDFTTNWTINSSSADANLVIDAGNTNRFNYIPSTTNAALTFANGTAIPDVAGLKFTQGGTVNLRLGFGTSLLYLNGNGIVVSIPCVSGDKVTVVGYAGNTAAIDRGFSVSEGTLNSSETSSNINTSGIMTAAGQQGTWVYNATSASIVLTTVTGGMNIQKITVTSGSSPTCNTYTVTDGTTTTYTVPELTPSTAYTYQIKATITNPVGESAFSSATTITTLNNTITQTIALSKGWNLISFNVNPPDSSIASLFASLNVQEIKNASAFWEKGQNAAFNSLTNLSAGNAYLINMNAAGSISITGTAVTPSIGTLKTGWQMVGCLYQLATPITTAFTILNITTIKNLDIFWHSDGAGTLQNIEPGKGYFVKVK